MIITQIALEGFGPLEKYEQAFHPDVNVLIGVNGSGKTTLMRILAGLCGIDEATGLIEDQRVVDHCTLEVSHDNQRFRYETSGRFDLSGIQSFKEALPERVSFPLTEWHYTFPSKCCDRATKVREVKQYFSEIFLPQYNPSAREISMIDDGLHHAMSLFLIDSPRGVPLLVESPERHLDIKWQRLLSRHWMRGNRQVFYTTHSPSMLANPSNCIEVCTKSR